MWSPFFPCIHASRGQCKPFVGIEAPDDHVQQTFLDGIEDAIGILGGPNAYVRAGGLLHASGGEGAKKECGDIRISETLTVNYRDKFGQL